MRLVRIHPTDVEWKTLDELPGRDLFQTRAWVEFVAASQEAEPVVAALLRGDRTVGWFTGLIVRRMGARILGSPLPGWTTPTMGFTFTEPVCLAEAAEALSSFAFADLRCVHLEFCDRHVGGEAPAGAAFETTSWQTFTARLGCDDDIFGTYTSACRRAVRKAEKVGVVVEQAHGLGFAAEYHEQLVGVFGRQGLAPTYGVDRVRHLITHLEPTGRLLLVRARNPDGDSIATGVFVGYADTAYFFGGASLREQQIHRPNEAVMWHAMRHWRDRGMTTFDFGGGGDYKRRYGGTELWTTAYHRSSVPGLASLRPIVRALVARRQRWQARIDFGRGSR